MAGQHPPARGNPEGRPYPRSCRGFVAALANRLALADAIALPLVETNALTEITGWVLPLDNPGDHWITDDWSSVFGNISPPSFPGESTRDFGCRWRNPTPVCIAPSPPKCATASSRFYSAAAAHGVPQPDASICFICSLNCCWRCSNCRVRSARAEVSRSNANFSAASEA